MNKALFYSILISFLSGIVLGRHISILQNHKVISSTDQKEFNMSQNKSSENTETVFEEKKTETVFAHAQPYPVNKKLMLSKTISVVSRRTTIARKSNVNENLDNRYIVKSSGTSSSPLEPSTYQTGTAKSKWMVGVLYEPNRESMEKFDLSAVNVQVSRRVIGSLFVSAQVPMDFQRVLVGVQVGF